MPDSRFQNKHTIVAAFILVFILFCVPLSSFSQTTTTGKSSSTPAELQQQANDLQTRFLNSENAAQNIFDSMNPGYRSTAYASFFDVTNAGIWMLWAILLGCILLLWGIRKSVIKIPLAMVKIRLTRDTATAPLAQKAEVITTKRALVQTAKIVKIKVRKIRSQKTKQ